MDTKTSVPLFTNYFDLRAKLTPENRNFRFSLFSLFAETNEGVRFHLHCYWFFKIVHFQYVLLSDNHVHNFVKCLENELMSEKRTKFLFVSTKHLIQKTDKILSELKFTLTRSSYYQTESFLKQGSFHHYIEKHDFTKHKALFIISRR